ncbi:hypothetical protein COB72_05515 [bacterium]|nr:MAG: hypothetical protein COB72_05515 [bacterium]
MAGDDIHAEIDNFLLTVGRWILGSAIGIGIVICIRVFIVIIQLPGFIIDSLIHTGRGVGLYKLRVFIPINIGLLWLANRLQSVDGDWVFLLWAVFGIKWMVEWIWAIARRSVVSGEHSMHPGVLLTSVIGITNLYVAFLFVAILGFVLMTLPTGWAIGGIIIYGAFFMIIVYAIASLLGVDHSIRDADKAYTARVSAQGDGGLRDHKTFGRVRVK